MINITVVVQYVGHVINAGGCVNYRTVVLELTPEQEVRLKLKQDEHYGPIVIESMQEGVVG